MLSTKILISFLLVASSLAVVYSQRVGGLGEEKIGDDEVKQIINKVRGAIDKEYPRPIKSIEPISYKTQTVAGKNYFIKALLHEANGQKTVAHLRIYKSFRGAVELASIKTDVKRHDSIEYFE